jgi:hypothetical protein
VLADAAAARMGSEHLVSGAQFVAADPDVLSEARVSLA